MALGVEKKITQLLNYIRPLSPTTVGEMQEWMLMDLTNQLQASFGTIHLRRRQFFTNFWPLPSYNRQFFSVIRRQIWQIFDPSSPKTTS